MISNSEKVKIFTEETGNNIPNKPEVMSKDEVKFLIKMMLDEILELYSTVEDPFPAKHSMIEMITKAKKIPKFIGAEEECIAEQADALIDCYYYSLNAMAKKGINLCSIFDVVHNANMNKKDKKTGKFIKNSEGKIIKPSNWEAPNILEEIIKQKLNGPFNKNL